MKILKDIFRHKKSPPQNDSLLALDEASVFLPGSGVLAEEAKFSAFLDQCRKNRQKKLRRGGRIREAGFFYEFDKKQNSPS